MSAESARDQLSACPACAAAGTRVLFELESPYVAGLRYRIRYCGACRHLHADGPLSEDVLRQVYGEAFHATSQQQAEGPSSAVVLNANWRAQWLRGRGLRGRLLDVGAGRGYFVKAAQPFFDVRGIDFSSQAAAYGEALGVALDSGDFLQAPYNDASFDVLTFWDVLASMSDVHATLARAARLLRPGGHAVFTVPMGDSLACRLAGKRWPLWIPPVNLHYFSAGSLDLLFRSHGLDVVGMHRLGKRVSLNFLLLKLARSLGARRLERSFGTLPLRWAVPVNLGDIQTVIVRKA